MTTEPDDDAMVTVPVIDTRDPLSLFQSDVKMADRLRRGATFGIAPLLGPVDRIARAWLARNQNPYLGELDAMNDGLSGPGLYLLNTVYEWCCSTLARPCADGRGAELLRVLDWSTPGLGESVVLARHDGMAGPWRNVTWPGAVGALTVSCPGRFSAALNQAPRRQVTGLNASDLIAGWVRVYRNGGLPAAHLLRQACETAPDFEAAVALLSDGGIRVSQPAFYILAGTRPEETCVIERLETEARVHRATGTQGIAVTNDWLSADLEGRPRGHGRGPAGMAEDCRARRAAILATPPGGAFGLDWVQPPILNDRTRLAVACDARSDEIALRGYEKQGRTAIPVADLPRRALAA